MVLYDRAGGESREAIGDEISAARGLTLIRPYDEPLVIAGQGTTGLESRSSRQRQLSPRPTCWSVAAAARLTSGIALALEAEAPGLRARPVEPAGFDDVTRSLASGRIEHNDRARAALPTRS